MRGRTLPPFDKVAYNASLVFVNEFNAFGNIPKTPQNLKLIGGHHIELPIKPLNQVFDIIIINVIIIFSRLNIEQKIKLEFADNNGHRGAWCHLLQFRNSF